MRGGGGAVKPALCGEQVTSQDCHDCGQRVVVNARWQPINPSAENGHRISRVRTQRFVCSDCLIRRERSRLLLAQMDVPIERRCSVCGCVLPPARKIRVCYAHEKRPFRSKEIR